MEPVPQEATILYSIVAVIIGLALIIHTITRRRNGHNTGGLKLGTTGLVLLVLALLVLALFGCTEGSGGIHGPGDASTWKVGGLEVAGAVPSTTAPPVRPTSLTSVARTTSGRRTGRS